MIKKFYRKNFLFLEFVLSVVLVCILFLVTKKYDLIEVLSDTLVDVRGGLYGNLAGLSGAMLGFVITGLSVLLTTGNSPQMEKLRTSKHYKDIFRIFFNTSKYLGIFLLVALMSLIIDNGDKPLIPIVFLNLWLLIIVGFRVCRCIWVLEKIVGLHIFKK